MRRLAGEWIVIVGLVFWAIIILGWIRGWFRRRHIEREAQIQAAVEHRKRAILEELNRQG